MLEKLLYLSIAGALGTLSRYGLAGLTHRLFGSQFPWGTLAVNMMGCLAAGVFWSLAESRLSISSNMRIIVMVGFMGAFTTFSAFILESGNLARDGQFLWMAGNMLIQNIGGLALFFTGLTIGKML